jgi:signal transduction histidine kinase
MNINGIGLGLVISENIVSQFDGEITFESEPKVGSTFTFMFLLSENESDQ